MQRPADLPPLNICIQVNISGEARRAVAHRTKRWRWRKAASGLPAARARPDGDAGTPALAAERRAASLRCWRGFTAEAKQQVAGIDTLSMGMSDDLEIAVASGSTMVRVGTALFGARPVNQQPG